MTPSAPRPPRSSSPRSSGEHRVAAAGQGASSAPLPSAEPAEIQAPKVIVKRSARRRRTVSAYRDGDTTVVLMPATMSRADEAQWVDEMLQRLERSEAKRRPSDDELLVRARRLARVYLPREVVPRSVRWVSNQQQRWGSCTPADATIRLSDRLRGMPDYVVDYVLVHELVHLLVPDHGARFVELMAAYPQAERARGFLEGWTAAPTQRGGSSLPESCEPDSCEPDSCEPDTSSS